MSAAAAAAVVIALAVPPAARAAAPSPATLPTTGQSDAGMAEAAGPQAFATARDAADAFAAAIRSGERAALLRVLGPDGDDVIDSGDPVADTASRTAFTRAFDARHDLSVSPDGRTVTLLLGDERWPMPIPVVREDAAQAAASRDVSGGPAAATAAAVVYRFDTVAGRDEIVNRRVGRNELDAMKVLAAIVDAQQDYARLPDALKRPAGATTGPAEALADVPAYADRFASSPGHHDGLYWPTGPGEPDSPLGPLIDQAADEGYADPATQPGTAPAVSPRTPYHGYYYRILTRQGPAAAGGAMDYRVGGVLLGGFAVVAWPADYGNSGVMTFLVNHTGVVHQRDLGPQTADAARSITAYDPTPEWTIADDAPKPASSAGDASTKTDAVAPATTRPTGLAPPG